ncbi:MAG: DGQHR domain-containing protein [Dehalococcoidales bacterium]
MRIKVIPFRQEGVQLYSGVVKAGDLVDACEVDVYREEGGEYKGYQRMPEPARTKKVASYLKNESRPLLPTSILLSYRGQLEKEGEFIDIPANSEIYIVDGQHRVYGIKRAIEEFGLDRLLDYELPIVIIENMESEDEANQFRIINETMKKVRTDLARRLLALKYSDGSPEGRRAIRLSGRVWEATSAEIIKILGMDHDSPWKGKIQPPNSRKESGHIVRELSFSTSLKPILNQRPYSTWTPTRLAEKIKYLWIALQELIPEAFETPNEYVIQKTPGVFSFHILAFDILEELRVNGISDPSISDIKNILTNLEEFISPDYWRNDNADGAAMAGSMKGFNLIADDMSEKLRDSGSITN